MRNTRRLRTGFTIVELLVSATLSMFIMGIIAVAFQKSIDTFRVLRSIGQMQEKLKSAQMVLKRDLSSEHFGGNFRPGFGGPYVRDQRLDLVGWTPPDEGFFSIIQGGDSINEGSDTDTIPSFMATNHSLHFSVKLRGNRDEEMFYASAPPNLAAMSPPDFSRPGLFASVWAEVCYYTAGNGQTANGQPLFTLYRRQRLALPKGTPLPPQTVPAWNTSPLEASYPDISWSTVLGNPRVNSSDDLTNPGRRLGLGSNANGCWASLPLSGTTQGDDILLTDVLSFEVKTNWTTGSASNLAYESFPAGALDSPFSVFPITSPPNGSYSASHRFFDTWSTLALVNPNLNWDDPTTWTSVNNPPPLRIRVNTIQIRLRIWDSNTQQARQVTIVQDI